MDVRKIREKARKHLEVTGQRRRAFAIEADVTPSTFYRFLDEDRNITLKNLVKIVSTIERQEEELRGSNSKTA